LHQHDYCNDPTGIPVVMPADMVDCRINTSRIARITAEKAREMAQYALLPGDVLLPRRGELDRRALVTPADCPAICGTGSIRVRPADPDQGTSIYYAISAETTVKYLRSKSQGSIMPSISATTVASICIANLSVPERDSLSQLTENASDAVEAFVDRSRELRLLRGVTMKNALSMP
jgi:type I restriction enzyme S subunit